MQALILATDETSKLHPLTERVPAPLLPVLNRPIMAYALELLVRSQLRDVGIAVYNKAGSIEGHFATGSGSAAKLTYLLQREPLGSAGSIRWAASGLKETFVVLPGDAIVTVDLCAALAFHRAKGSIATVVVHAPLTNGAAAAGYPLNGVAVAPGGRVAAISARAGEPVEAPGSRTFANTGAYIFEPRILEWINPREVLDCHSDLLPRLLASHGAGEAVHAFITEGYWNPIHSVPAYHQAQLDALACAMQTVGGRQGAPSPDGSPPAGGAEAAGVRYVSVEDKELAPGILTGRHVSIHPSARLAGPIYIGAGSQIERDVELGPDVVIGPNTIVDEGATVRNSSILEGTYVGRLVKVDGRVVRGGLVVDAGSGESLRVVDPFLLGEVSPRLIRSLLARAADCAGALLLLLLFLPALALIALALLVTSPLTGRPGRVIEARPRARWQRTGEQDGGLDHGVAERQIYGVLYFRTRREDGKVLPLGAYLERSQFDRLPALLSVLRGDLRLVGVKPLEPAEADRLTEEWQRLPYEQPAGFTGLWYVESNGAALSDLTDKSDRDEMDALDETVAADAYYTATRSLLGDLYLLLYTPVAWVGRHAPVRRGTRRRQWTLRPSRAKAALIR